MSKVRIAGVPMNVWSARRILGVKGLRGPTRINRCMGNYIRNLPKAGSQSKAQANFAEAYNNCKHK